MLILQETHKKCRNSWKKIIRQKSLLSLWAASCLRISNPIRITKKQLAIIKKLSPSCTPSMAVRCGICFSSFPTVSFVETTFPVQQVSSRPAPVHPHLCCDAFTLLIEIFESFTCAAPFRLAAFLICENVHICKPTVGIDLDDGRPFMGLLRCYRKRERSGSMPMIFHSVWKIMGWVEKEEKKSDHWKWSSEMRGFCYFIILRRIVRWILEKRMLQVDRRTNLQELIFWG